MSNARDRKGYAHVGVDGGRGEGSERRHDMNDSGNEVGPRLKVGPLDSGATHGSIATASWHLFSPRDVPVICPPPNLAFISSLDCSSGLRASVAGGASHSRCSIWPWPDDLQHASHPPQRTLVDQQPQHQAVFHVTMTKNGARLGNNVPGSPCKRRSRFGRV
jgi:hypothetical protein